MGHRVRRSKSLRHSRSSIDLSSQDTLQLRRPSKPPRLQSTDTFALPNILPPSTSNGISISSNQPCLPTYSTWPRSQPLGVTSQSQAHGDLGHPDVIQHDSVNQQIAQGSEPNLPINRLKESPSKTQSQSIALNTVLSTLRNRASEPLLASPFRLPTFRSTPTSLPTHEERPPLTSYATSIRSRHRSQRRRTSYHELWNEYGVEVPPGCTSPLEEGEEVARCDSPSCLATHDGHQPYRHSISCSKKRREWERSRGAAAAGERAEVVASAAVPDVAVPDMAAQSGKGKDDSHEASAVCPRVSGLTILVHLEGREDLVVSADLRKWSGGG